jgi:subtilase family serine protease
MLADANQFFVGQGVPGFAPGQYTEDFGGDNESASALGASCDNEPDQPEEALDVETAHIAAPDAHVVYMGSDCAGDVEQNFLDTMTNIVDHHLADVVTDSYSISESQFSPATRRTKTPKKPSALTTCSCVCSLPISMLTRTM